MRRPDQRAGSDPVLWPEIAIGYIAAGRAGKVDCRHCLSTTMALHALSAPVVLAATDASIMARLRDDRIGRDRWVTASRLREPQPGRFPEPPSRLAIRLCYARHNSVRTERRHGCLVVRVTRDIRFGALTSTHLTPGRPLGSPFFIEPNHSADRWPIGSPGRA